LVRSAAVSTILAALCAFPAAAQSQRPAIAVLNFEFGSIQHWWSGNQDIGQGIADLLVDELVNDGSFRMIERKKLDAILAEQDFSQSERADPSAKTLAKVGKMLGVKYLVVGSVTKFGTEKSNKSIGGGGFGSKFGPDIQGIVAAELARLARAPVKLMLDRAEEVTSKGEGTSKRSGLLLSGGGGGAVSTVGHIEFGSSDFRDTILGEATDAAVKATAAKLIGAKSRLQ
jgi:curli biogenesis system outer membrane secretion channel CsgG